jgi:hypothetical protein
MASRRTVRFGRRSLSAVSPAISTTRDETSVPSTCELGKWSAMAIAWLLPHPGTHIRPPLAVGSPVRYVPSSWSSMRPWCAASSTKSNL